MPVVSKANHHFHLDFLQVHAFTAKVATDNSEALNRWSLVDFFIVTDSLYFIWSILRCLLLPIAFDCVSIQQISTLFLHHFDPLLIYCSYRDLTLLHWHFCVILFLQGSDVDLMKKRAERFGDITSSKLGKVFIFQFEYANCFNCSYAFSEFLTSHFCKILHKVIYENMTNIWLFSICFILLWIFIHE